MISVWDQGRETVEELIKKKELQKVPPNKDLALEYLKQAKAHLDMSRDGLAKDPIGAFQLAYDAARKSLASLLIVQGLRPTTYGGHIAVFDAVLAQFGKGLGSVIRPFSSMRRLRNMSEYPSAENLVANKDDAEAAQQHAAGMLEAASKLIEELPPY